MCLVCVWVLRLDPRGPGSSTAVFSLVEANQFKELTHLSLHFRPGNDTTVKVLGSLSALRPSVRGAVGLMHLLVLMVGLAFLGRCTLPSGCGR